jgi:hypothetical protein
MRVNEQGVWMLEVAARPIGGLCARVLPGLPERILKQAVGEYTAGGTLFETAAGVQGAAGVLMIPIPREGIFHGVSGIDRARAVEGIEDVIMTAKEGQRLIPLPEGSSYLGFIFARATTPEQVEAALRAAQAKLEYDILTALPVL